MYLASDEDTSRGWHLLRKERYEMDLIDSSVVIRYVRDELRIGIHACLMFPPDDTLISPQYVKMPSFTYYSKSSS